MDSANPFHLIDVLIEHNVPFVLIGGHAVTFHGYVRATEDTDILFMRNEQSEQDLFRALVALDARWIGDEVDPSTGIERTYPVSQEFIRANRLMMLVTKEGYLDIFDFVPGHPDTPVAQVFQSAVECDSLRFPSLSWLRKMKQASGGPKDQNDLQNLPSEPD